MTQDNKLFQDIYKLANSAIASAANVKSELSHLIKLQIEMLLKNMNFVTKEEFEIVKKMAEKNSIEIKKILKQDEYDDASSHDMKKKSSSANQKKI